MARLGQHGDDLGEHVLEHGADALGAEIDRTEGMRRLYDEIEEPLLSVLSRMETTGVKVDLDSLRDYAAGLRREMLEAIRYVDLVIPESCWEQKRTDVETYRVDVVCMGSDWAGDERFEALRDLCDVVYLDRTDGISTTDVKSRLKG